MAKATSKFDEAIKGTEFEGKTEAQVKNALYSQALQALRNQYIDDFNNLVSEAYENYGLTYRRRLTDEEKAEQQVRALIAANPTLSDRFVEVGKTDGGAPTV